MTSLEYSNNAFYDTLELIILVLLMLFICSVNMLTLVTVGYHRNMWTVPNMYVASLAMADFLTGLQVMYGMLPLFPSLKVVFDHDKMLCLWKHVTLFTAVTTSILNMDLIAIDRWAYITHPFAYTRLATVKKALIIIACTWFIGIFLGTVSLYVNKWNNDCRFFKVLDENYQVYVQGGLFCASTVVIAGCYLHIFRIVVKQRATILKQKKSVCLSIDATGKDGKKSNDRKMKKLRRDWNLIKMFGIMFGVFFCCVTPVMICGVLTYKLGILQGATSITVPLVILNSGMNFFIYVFRNRQFQLAVKATLSGCRKALGDSSWSLRDTSVTTGALRTDTL